MSQTDTPPADPTFQLKGSMLSVTVLELTNNDLVQLEQQLAEKAAQAPNFFQDTPILLALDKLDNEQGITKLKELVDICKRQKLHPLAVRTGNSADTLAAQALGFLVLPPSVARDKQGTPLQPGKAETLRNTEYRPTKVINTPIRSGQQLYAKDGDLIVLAPVSSGAELIADGNIHVYAPLRGRAIAGAKGDPDTRIFCQQLNAELISIAGHYKTSEELRREPNWGESVQISLVGDLLNIRAL